MLPHRAAAGHSAHSGSTSKVGSGMVAAIPSPHTGVYHLGPFTLHMYGVMLLLAIAACIWLTGRRWVAWGGDWDLVFRIAVWGVIAGVVGARIYHLITSWNQDPAIHAHWYGPFAVWEGGLGVWGGIPAGIAVGAWIVKRSGYVDGIAGLNELFDGMTNVPLSCAWFWKFHRT